jgi:hypothetical protein
MLADRIRMSVFQSTKKDDPLGSIGSQDLILGDSMAGYFGTVNGLITNTELTNLMAMTSGTLLDSANTDITFHKFIHKGRILLIPSRPIKHSISWNNIQAQNGVKGKVVTINGQEYLCRLMTGSRHYYTNNPSIAGGEWDDLFVRFHVNNGGILTDEDIYVIPVNGRVTLCQEVSDKDISQRIHRGNGSYNQFWAAFSNNPSSVNGWRPVLEVL